MNPTAAERHDRPVPWLWETLIVLCVLFGAAGVLAPRLLRPPLPTKAVRAQLDMQAIAEGLGRYSLDTHLLPTGVGGRTNVTWLHGPGQLPAEHSFGTPDQGRSLAAVLMTAEMGGEAWKGPYLTELRPDPWGRAYLVNAEGWILARERPMVLSAGPDGRVQTPPWATRPVGDDLLLPLD
jgi:hypothetical protein